MLRGARSCAGAATAALSHPWPSLPAMTAERCRLAGPPGPGGGAAHGTRPSLSPSRAADFKTCPLLYRFRSIDRLPERPTPDAGPGHARARRAGAAVRPAGGGAHPESAGDLVAPQWDRLVDRGAGAGRAVRRGRRRGRREFLASAARAARRLLRGGGPAPARAGRAGEPDLGGGRRRAADPRATSTGSTSRPDGDAAGGRLQDRRRAPGGVRGAGAVPAKFYALVLWRTRGVVPRVLRLLYLKDAEVCDYTPDAEELLRFERTLVALWQAIERATARAGFPAPAQPALRLVQPPGALPELRRHPAAVPGSPPPPTRCATPAPGRSPRARTSESPSPEERAGSASATTGPAGRRPAFRCDRIGLRAVSTATRRPTGSGTDRSACGGGSPSTVGSCGPVRGRRLPGVREHPGGAGRGGVRVTRRARAARARSRGPRAPPRRAGAARAARREIR